MFAATIPRPSTSRPGVRAESRGRGRRKNRPDLRRRFAVGFPAALPSSPPVPVRGRIPSNLRGGFKLRLLRMVYINFFGIPLRAGERCASASSQLSGVRPAPPVRGVCGVFAGLSCRPGRAGSRAALFAAVRVPVRCLPGMVKPRDFRIASLRSACKVERLTRFNISRVSESERNFLAP